MAMRIAYQPLCGQTARGDFPLGDSDAVRWFRQWVKGMTRLPVRGLENMKRGTVVSAPVAVYRILAAGRAIGLPREWGLRFAAWVRATVDGLWPLEPTPLAARRRRVLELESVAVIREMHTVSVPDCPDALDAEIAATEAEVAAEIDKLGALHAERRRRWTR